MTAAADVDTGRSLYEVLADVPDPRAASGLRHDLQSVLTLVVVALLTGARSLCAIVQFARDRKELARALGFDKKAKRSKRELGPPCVSTLHYLFKELDAEAFERALTAWITGLLGQDTAPAIAIDGKTLRGSQTQGVPGMHLVAAYAHRLGSAVAQLKVDAKTNEHKATLQLLKMLPLQGSLVTGDAAPAQKEVCAAILKGGGDYFLTVKDNQPTLKQDIARVFEGDFSPSRSALA